MPDKPLELRMPLLALYSVAIKCVNGFCAMGAILPRWRTMGRIRKAATADMDTELRIRYAFDKIPHDVPIGQAFADVAPDVR